MLACTCMQKQHTLPLPQPLKHAPHRRGGGTTTLMACEIHQLSRDRRDCYLNYFVQNPLPSLVFAIAEETVCVDVVRVTVQFDTQEVRSLWVLIVLDCKGDLCRCSTEVHWPYSLLPFRVCVFVPKVFLQIWWKRLIKSCNRCWPTLDRFTTASHLQEFSLEVVDSDPAVQPFFLTSNDGSILEVERQSFQVFTETRQDFIGLLFIFLTEGEAERGGDLGTLLQSEGGR